MLFCEKGLYYFVGVGLLFGFAFQMVSLNANGSQEPKTEGKCEVILYYNYTTWEDAKNSCMQRNATLLDNKRDIQRCIGNKSGNGIWIGLKKNASNLTESVREANIDDLFKIRKCESGNIAGDFRNDSCSNKLLPSFCRRGRCKDRCKGNNSRCFLPVHDRMTWFGSFAHCKSLNRVLDAGNISKALLCNASLAFETSYFWTGKIYESNIDTSANWTWLNGSLFTEWDIWKIIITDVGCSGCGFWKNGTIYLTSNCSQNFSDLCEGDGQYGKQKSWYDANSNCANALQVPTGKNTYLMNSGNKSYWLGIYKKKSCETHMIANLTNVMELKLSKCPYVGYDVDEQDCYAKSRAICVQQVICDTEDWLRFRNSCYKVEGPETCRDVPAICEKYQAELVEILDSEEAMFINNTVKDKGLIVWFSGDKTFSGKSSSLKLCARVPDWFKQRKKNEERNYVICEKKFKANCPNHWNLAYNSFCWRVFDKVLMTWQAAHTFCLHQNSRLANLNDVQVIRTNSSALKDGEPYWTNGTQIKVYPPHDPLQDWYWLDGRQFNASQRRGLYARLTYTGGEERCAIIRDSQNGIWEDSPCSASHSFICKKGETIKNTNDPTKSKEAKAKILKAVDSLLALRLMVEEKLFEITKEVIGIVNSSSFKGSFKNTTENGIIVEVLTTSLDRLHEWREIITSIPNVTIWKLCQNEPDCEVKRITMLLKNITVNCSVLSDSSCLVNADIIILVYIANGQLISKLKENETVSLKFSKHRKSVTREEVGCLFLDGVKWSNEGTDVGSIVGENIECLTDHLSSFTMVVLDEEVDESNKVALNLITYIGSGLSLAALSFTCIVYIVLYKDLQILTMSRHLVHFNLQIALGLTQIVFLAGGSATRSKIICKVIAILVHYFSMAAFTWILLEAVMLYLQLISVYGGLSVRMKNFMLFGWGFPLLLVGLSAGVKIDGYGTDQWCWLSYKDGFLWFFFAPVVIITSVILVTVITVTRVIVSKSKGADAKKRIISAARGVIILFATLGLSWGFSVIAVNHDALVWKYLFAIFTSLQGFLIFLNYGVCNPKIRMAVCRKMGFEVQPAIPMTQRRQ